MWRNLDIEAHKNMAHKVEVKGHVVKVENVSLGIQTI